MPEPEKLIDSEAVTRDYINGYHAGMFDAIFIGSVIILVIAFAISVIVR